MSEYLVRVDCMTYNHAPYIEDAMNGFCIQQTDFPFVCTIIDDASTDREAEVIKKYLEKHFALDDKNVARNEETDDYLLIFAQHKSNKNCFFAVFLLKYNHYQIKKAKNSYWVEWDDTKYVAFCEGDDYWIDPLKLQKQVDYMEDYPEYGLVRTNVNEQNVTTGKMQKKLFSSGAWLKIRDTHQDSILHGWFTAPCTWLYRKELMENQPHLDSNKYFLGDMFISLNISAQGKMAYLDDVTAVYRVLPSSASHGLSARQRYSFFNKNSNTRLYYAKRESLGFRLRFWFTNSFTRWRCFKSDFAFYPSILKDAFSDIKELFFQSANSTFN